MFPTDLRSIDHASLDRDHPPENHQHELLLIAPTYSPAPGVGGVRVEGLQKYLARHGWRVTVLAPAVPGRPRNLDHVIEMHSRPLIPRLREVAGLEAGESISGRLGYARVESAGTRVVRSATSLVKAFFAYPDQYRARIRPGVTTALAAYPDAHPDAVLSSSPPVSHHVIASRVADHWGIPWVADLRDLWSDNPYSNNPRFRRWFDRRLEQRTLNAASRVTSVSVELAEALEARLSRNIDVVPNGFDEEQLAFGNQPLPAKKLVIAHTGGLYEGKRDPSALLHALRRLLDRGEIKSEQVEVRFLGPKEGWLDQQIRGLELGDVVRQEGLVDRSTSRLVQRQSTALLLLTWNHPAERGTCPAKLFEYMAASRPVIALGSTDNAAARIVRETGIGQVFAPDDVERLAGFVKMLYDSRDTAATRLYAPNRPLLDSYSQNEMARRMAAVLDDALNATKPERRGDSLG